MHLITKLLNFLRNRKIISIITNILPTGMCVCCNIGGSYRIGGVNMIGKGFFKVDFYFKNVAEATKFVHDIEQDKDLAFNAKLQAIHSEKRIPVVTLQVRSGYTVNRLIGWLDDFEHFGYCVWLSKEDDFYAIVDCKCHCIDNQLSNSKDDNIESVNDDQSLESEVHEDDSESITTNED